MQRNRPFPHAARIKGDFLSLPFLKESASDQSRHLSKDRFPHKEQGFSARREARLFQGEHPSEIVARNILVLGPLYQPSKEALLAHAQELLPFQYPFLYRPALHQPKQPRNANFLLLPQQEHFFPRRLDQQCRRQKDNLSSRFPLKRSLEVPRTSFFNIHINYFSNVIIAHVTFRKNKMYRLILLAMSHHNAIIAL